MHFLFYMYLFISTESYVVTILWNLDEMVQTNLQNIGICNTWNTVNMVIIFIIQFYWWFRRLSPFQEPLTQ